MNRKYSLKELKLICHTLNVLRKKSHQTDGVNMNTFHFTRFYNNTHHIDFNERQQRFNVYKQYKGWQSNSEIFI